MSFIAMDDDFLCLAHLFAVTAAHGGAVEIDAGTEAAAVAVGQVPRQGVESRGTGGRERTAPHLAPGKVENLH